MLVIPANVAGCEPDEAVGEWVGVVGLDADEDGLLRPADGACGPPFVPVGPDEVGDDGDGAAAAVGDAVGSDRVDRLSVRPNMLGHAFYLALWMMVAWTVSLDGTSATRARVAWRARSTSPWPAPRTPSPR